MKSWVKVSQRSSWHILDPGKPARTFCGRPLDGPLLAEPPSGERTCESCFRIRDRRASK